MEETKGWLTILEIVIGIFILILFLVISWYFYFRLKARPDSLAEAQSVLDSQEETPIQPEAENRLPSYEEATQNRPGLRHRNSRDTNLTSDDVRNNITDTVESNSDQASCSQNQSGESSKNSNDDTSPAEHNSGVRYISENESICLYGVYGDVESIVKNDNENIHDDGGEKTCKDSGSSIGNSKDGSSSQNFSEDMNVIENIGEFNNEDGNKNEDAIKKVDTVDNEKCGKEYDAGKENITGKDRHDKCEDDINSIANSEAKGVGQCCSADDISISSKYDTASGGSGVSME